MNASTTSCPSSTPALNPSSDVNRCDPANWRDSPSWNENPNPCTSPKPKAHAHRRPRVLPTMFSSAMKTIEAAISISMSGGNHSALGASPITDATRVIECATVKAVTTETSGQKRRSGMTRQSRKRRWSTPSRMCAKPRGDESQQRLVPARVEAHPAGIAPVLEDPLGAVRGDEAQDGRRADAQVRPRGVDREAGIG